MSKKVENADKKKLAVGVFNGLIPSESIDWNYLRFKEEIKQGLSDVCEGEFSARGEVF